MSVAALKEVTAPPVEPAETGRREDWRQVESTLGTALPSDYKEYIDTYGTGKLADFLLPLNPFSKNPHLNLIQQVPRRLGALRELKQQGGDRACPYPLFPESGGLLPWGITDNGDVLYWRTEGRPDHWGTVVNESRGPEFEQFDEPMTDFVAGVLSKRIVCRIFPEDFPGPALAFVSVTS
jgi:hypothetical protein